MNEYFLLPQLEEIGPSSELIHNTTVQVNTLFYLWVNSFIYDSSLIDYELLKFRINIPLIFMSHTTYWTKSCASIDTW